MDDTVTNEIDETLDDQVLSTDASFELIASQHFASWLGGLGISLAFTTPDASKLFLIGLEADGALSISERTIDQCKGIAVHGTSLYAASRWQIWRFENALQSGQVFDGHDAVYVPKASHVTGDVNCHEMAVDWDGRLVFVNTTFNCLSYLSRDYSFNPIWRPSFISEFAPEDRCHLTGLAMLNGEPAYVTAASTSNEANGWRDKTSDGGVLIDVRSGDIACSGLSMPHSPRVHGNTVWLQNSGTGYLGRVDVAAKSFEPVTFCPGYLRGMDVIGNFAICGLSKVANDADIDQLQLKNGLEEHETEPRCGLVVIDLVSGVIRHWLRLEGMVNEVAGVNVVPSIVRPRAVGFKSNEIERSISLPPDLE